MNPKEAAYIAVSGYSSETSKYSLETWLKAVAYYNANRKQCLQAIGVNFVDAPENRR